MFELSAGYVRRACKLGCGAKTRVVKGRAAGARTDGDESAAGGAAGAFGWSMWRDSRAMCVDLARWARFQRPQPAKQAFREFSATEEWAKVPVSGNGRGWMQLALVALLSLSLSCFWEWQSSRRFPMVSPYNKQNCCVGPLPAFGSSIRNGSTAWRKHLVRTSGMGVRHGAIVRCGLWCSVWRHRSVRAVAQRLAPSHGTNAWRSIAVQRERPAWHYWNREGRQNGRVADKAWN